jgi:hypothetical protein
MFSFPHLGYCPLTLDEVSFRMIKFGRYESGTLSPLYSDERFRRFLFARL